MLALTCGSSTSPFLCACVRDASQVCSTDELTWQTNVDMPQRKEILAKIVMYLQQRKPPARPEWVQKVRCLQVKTHANSFFHACDFYLSAPCGVQWLSGNCACDAMCFGWA